MTRTKTRTRTHFARGKPNHRPFQPEDDELFNPPVSNRPLCGLRSQQYAVITVNAPEEAFRHLECGNCRWLLEEALRRDVRRGSARPSQHRDEGRVIPWRDPDDARRRQDPDGPDLPS